ncbi:uncharacterized protein BT62DRAFT_936863, partial [Guyanagaster necrorhizus]
MGLIIQVDTATIFAWNTLEHSRDTEVVVEERKKVANALIVHEEDNITFLDLLEYYFAQSEDILKKDERLELSIKPKRAVDTSCLRVIELLVASAEHIKERWLATMEKWGDVYETILQRVENLADMASTGLGLRAETFREAGRYGYPGSYVWARNTGRRISVQIPERNYLLVQAGVQLEYLSCGLIKAGYHEVVVNDKTIVVIEQRKREHPSRLLIRILSTFLWHLSSDYDLEPIPALAEHSRAIRTAYINLEKDDGEETVYGPMKFGQQVR